MGWRSFIKPRNNQGRVKFLALFFIIFSVLIILRLFDVQILRGYFYTALASGQHELYQKLFPERGSIYVLEKSGTNQTLFPLVTNRDLKMLYASPAEIKEPKAVAEKLFKILGFARKLDVKEMKKIEKDLFADISDDLDPKIANEIKQARREKWEQEQTQAEVDRLTKILSKKNDPYEPIRRRLTDAQVAQIKALGVDGLYFKDETWRFYPEDGVGGHIFGFWGFSDNEHKGQYGLEGYFDDILAGQQGEIRSEKDVWGNIIAIGSHSLKEKLDGSDLVLTIDRAIQYKVCQALYQGVKAVEAEGGSIIVLNPKTGAVLAMCGFPDYNPDEYYKVDSIGVYNNPAISLPYEPGSIFKPITMAAALDSGKVTPQTTYVDYGQMTIGPDKDVIKNFNHEAFGRSSMTRVLEKSINTGAVWAMQQTTPKVFVQYVRDFGFGRPTGIQLESEASGDISNLKRSGEIYAATASYGQGILVTPLQMVSAIAAIANNGRLMKPRIVSQIIEADGQVKNFPQQEIKQVISSKSARMLSAMMVSVVENGQSAGARVNGYRVAGKTGTALVASKNKAGYTDDVIVSFVGFAPFNNPQFAMIVRVDKPQKGKTGASVAAPIFGRVAKFILQYYNVPYDR